MAESTVVKVKRDGTILLADNSGFGGGNVYTVAYEPGDFSMNIPLETRNDFLDRGRAVPSVRYGDDQLITGSFSAYMRDVFDSSAATLFDILNWTTAALGTSYVDDNWVSTLGANAEVKTVDIRLTIEGTDHGDGADHSITVTDCSLDSSLAEGDPNTHSVNYRSHTDVRPTRA